MPTKLRAATMPVAGESLPISKILKHPAWKPTLQSPKTPKPELESLVSTFPLPTTETEAWIEEADTQAAQEMKDTEREVIASEISAGKELFEQDMKENMKELLEAIIEMEEDIKEKAKEITLGEEIASDISAMVDLEQVTKEKAIREEEVEAAAEREKATKKKDKEKTKAEAVTADKQNGARVRFEKAKIEAKEKAERDRLANKRAARKQLEYENLIRASQSSREKSKKEKISHAREKSKKEKLSHTREKSEKEKAYPAREKTEKEKPTQVTHTHTTRKHTKKVQFEKGIKEQEPAGRTCACRKTRQAKMDTEEKVAKHKPKTKVKERLENPTTARKEPPSKEKKKAEIKAQPADSAPVMSRVSVGAASTQRTSGSPAQSDSFAYCLP
ncbi:hypothetical protein BDD12DRAFT_802700 [Trichophaea hybrida]|nr:hypothetical protein BDD12DRAFT_802700 [Trichophaea hybrida]